ncbi:MAG: TonB-dependent receptor [Bacteroides sp.]|nr:TonB-dependent receptor [Bacteroides sp.]
MRRRSNRLRCFTNKGLYLVGAFIYSFLFPVLTLAQTQPDTIPIQSIDTVVVRAGRHVGNHFITRENIQRIPSLLGENDLIKYLATLPGVVSVNALDPGIYVRGGHSVENAYLVNGTEVANPNHLTGIISVFDPYILGNSTFYKSGYPARYNNYLSSYINMLPTVGDKEHIRGEVTAGLLSSAVKLQGPLVNSRHSFAFSARTSYLQHVARIYNRTNDGGDMPSYGFSDVTLNLNSDIASRWNLNVFGLYTTDKLDINLVKHSIQHDLKWSSFSSNVRARYTGNRGVLTLTGGFNSSMTSGASDSYTEIDMKNSYTDRLGNVHYDGYVHENIHYNLGVGLSASSCDLAGQGKTDVEIYKLYGGVQVGLTHDLTLEAGLNFQHYNGRAHSNDVSPRARLNYQWRGFNFRMDYARTIQYTTLYPYFTLKSPVDMHYPLAEGYKPASSSHYSLGTDTRIGEDLSVYIAFSLKR